VSVGVRVPPRPPWGEQRAAIAGTLLDPGTSTTRVWPPGCFIRRTAWHVLHHAWELEDKSR
jgi:hypothetical protein